MNRSLFLGRVIATALLILNFIFEVRASDDKDQIVRGVLVETESGSCGEALTEKAKHVAESEVLEKYERLKDEFSGLPPVAIDTPTLGVGIRQFIEELAGLRGELNRLRNIELDFAAGKISPQEANVRTLALINSISEAATNELEEYRSSPSREDRLRLEGRRLLLSRAGQTLSRSQKVAQNTDESFGPHDSGMEQDDSSVNGKGPEEYHSESKSQTAPGKQSEQENNSQASEQRAETVGQDSISGEQDSELGGQDSSAGEQGSESGGESSSAGEQGSELGSQNSSSGEQSSESGGQDLNGDEESSCKEKFKQKFNQLFGIEPREDNSREANSKEKEVEGAQDLSLSETNKKKENSEAQSSESGGQSSSAGEQGSESGGQDSSAGEQGSESGGQDSSAEEQGSESGSQSSSAGEQGSESGGQDSSAGEQGSESGSQSSSAGEQGSESGGQNSSTGEQDSESGSQSSSAGEQGSESGGQDSSAGEQGSESGGQSSSAGEQGSESGSQSSSAGEQGSESGNQSSSAGEQGSESGSQSSSAGEQGSESGSQSSSAGEQNDWKERFKQKFSQFFDQKPQEESERDAGSRKLGEKEKQDDSKTGSQKQRTGEQGSESGSQSSSAGEQGSESGSQSSSAGEQGSESGNQSSSVGEQSSESGSQSSSVGEQSSESSSQSSSAGEQGSESGSQSSSAGEQGSESGGQDSSAGEQGSESGGQSSSAGEQGSELGSQSSSAGGQGSEVETPNSGTQEQNSAVDPNSGNSSSSEGESQSSSSNEDKGLPEKSERDNNKTRASDEFVQKKVDGKSSNSSTEHQNGGGAGKGSASAKEVDDNWLERFKDKFGSMLTSMAREPDDFLKRDLVKVDKSDSLSDKSQFDFNKRSLTYEGEQKSKREIGQDSRWSDKSWSDRFRRDRKRRSASRDNFWSRGERRTLTSIKEKHIHELIKKYMNSLWAHVLRRSESSEKLLNQIVDYKRLCDQLASKYGQIEYLSQQSARVEKFYSYIESAQIHFRKLEDLAVSLISKGRDDLVWVKRHLEFLSRLYIEIDMVDSLDGNEREVFSLVQEILQVITAEEVDPDENAMGEAFVNQLPGPLSRKLLKRTYPGDHQNPYDFSKLVDDLEKGDLVDYLTMSAFKSALRMTLPEIKKPLDHLVHNGFKMPIDAAPYTLEEASEMEAWQFFHRDGPVDLDGARLISGDLLQQTYREPVTQADPRDKKKAYVTIVLWDRSGSMKQDSKSVAQTHLIRAYLDQSQVEVVQKKASHKVISVPFDSIPRAPETLSTMGESQEFFDRHRQELLQGGGSTDITKAIVNAYELILEAQKEGGDLKRANILLVTDGDDGIRESDILEAREKIDPKIKIAFNVICLGGDNSDLKNVVESNIDSQNSSAFGYYSYQSFEVSEIAKLVKASHQLEVIKDVARAYTLKDVSLRNNRKLVQLKGAMNRLARGNGYTLGAFSEVRALQSLLSEPSDSQESTSIGNQSIEAILAHIIHSHLMSEWNEKHKLETLKSFLGIWSKEQDASEADLLASLSVDMLKKIRHWLFESRD